MYNINRYVFMSMKYTMCPNSDSRAVTSYVSLSILTKNVYVSLSILTKNHSIYHLIQLNCMYSLKEMAVLQAGDGY